MDNPSRTILQGTHTEDDAPAEDRGTPELLQDALKSLMGSAPAQGRDQHILVYTAGLLASAMILPAASHGGVQHPLLSLSKKSRG